MGLAVRRFVGSSPIASTDVVGNTTVSAVHRRLRVSDRSGMFSRTFKPEGEQGDVLRGSLVCADRGHEPSAEVLCDPSRLDPEA